MWTQMKIYSCFILLFMAWANALTLLLTLSLPLLASKPLSLSISAPLYIFFLCPSVYPLLPLPTSLSLFPSPTTVLSFPPFIPYLQFSLLYFSPYFFACFRCLSPVVATERKINLRIYFVSGVYLFCPGVSLNNVFTLEKRKVHVV